VTGEALSHHDLCFGCGQANLFGLQMEVSRRPDGTVTGRFFVKQDHQGPPGDAHGGIVAAALEEAMSLLAGGAPAERLEVEQHAPAPVGTYVLVEAEVEEADGGRLHLRATAADPDQHRGPIATARATFGRS
jgi:acyl-coenzyme A thioesterase PaaI-like protein